MIYNLILILSLPFAIPAFLLLALFNIRYRTGLLERLGFWSLPSHVSPLTSHGFPTFWIHAASVGEVLAAWPLALELSRRYPSSRFLFTTLTLTGRSALDRLVREKWGDRPDTLIRLFPVDLPGVALRLLKKLKPDLVLLIETELWPNFLNAAHRLGIPIMVVNGRITLRSFSRYRWVGPILKRSLSGIERFFMQTPSDAERIIKLGAPPQRVAVMGNLKLDSEPASLLESERADFLMRWGWKRSDPVWVAGSTHPGEEELIIKVFQSLKKHHPDLRLILAPRHIERASEVEALLKRHHLNFTQLTTHNSGQTHRSAPTPFDVILVNTMGQLGRLYGLARIAFVGGTLAPIGGHNLAEPCLLGKPVLFGPNTQHVQVTADLLTESGGGIPVEDGLSLEKTVRALLEDPGLAVRLGEQARKALELHRGAVHKAAEGISDRLPMLRFRRLPRFDQRSVLQRWVEDRLWPSRGGFITRPAAAAFGAAGWVYGGAVRIRETSYRIGILRSKRLSRPVISVGNLTLGGAGKTPAVIAIGRLLLSAGLRPAVLSRGYGGRNRAPVLIVSDGREVRFPANIAGDEPVLLAQKLRDVPVLIGADRVEVGRAAVASFRPDVLILDDGFQHRRLSRDLDLVLLDAAAPFGNGYLIPRGSLREPASHLRRADALLLTRVESPQAVQETVGLLKQIKPDIPCLLSRHQLTGWVSLCPKTGTPFVSASTPIVALPAKRVFIVAGIAKPEAFFRSVTEAGLEITGTWIVPDHHPFTHAEIAAIEREAERLHSEAILTTEKDAVRLRTLTGTFDKWWAAAVELEVFDPKAWEGLVFKAVGHNA
jgi:tetraacyldisaccharide 4'-kinase